MKDKTSIALKISVPIVYSGLYFVATFLGKTGAGRYDVVIFPIGVLIGILILLADEDFFYKFYNDKYKEKKYLVTRSLVFMLSLLPLGIFLMTSTGSAFGVGMFLGIVSGLSIEMIQYRSSVDQFKDRFLLQLKRPVHQAEVDRTILIFTTLSVLFGILIVCFGR